MSSTEYSIRELFDALDDLEDGIQYVREIAQEIMIDYGFGDDLEEEDVKDDSGKKEDKETQAGQSEPENTEEK